MAVRIKQFVLLASLLMTAFASQAQVSWMRCSGGLRDDACIAVCTDPAGNIFSTGYYYDATVTFDTIALPNFGGDDIYFNKYDPNGRLLWSKHFGTIDGDRPTGIACDTSGNVYLAGYAYGSMAFDTITMDMEGLFLSKMDNNGKLIWINTYPADFSYNAKHTISTDMSGNVFMVGNFYTSVTFDQPLQAINSQSWSSDLFVAKFSSVGIPLWSHALGGASSEYAYTVAADPFGNAFVTGEYYGPWMKIGADTLFNSYPLSPSNYEYKNLFVVRFTADGAISWARQTDVTNDEGGSGVSSNSKGACMVAGSFAGDTLFFANDTLVNLNGFNYNKSLFLLTFDSLGNELWARSAQGNDYGSKGQALITNASDEILLLAEHDSHFLSIGDTVLSNPDAWSELVLARYDENGNFMEACQSDGNKSTNGNGLCLGIDQKAILACTTYSTNLTFGALSINRGIDNAASLLVKFGQPIFSSVASERTNPYKVLLSPNPADAKCTISSSNHSKDLGVTNIRIYDMAGSCVKRIVADKRTEQGVEIETQTLADGLYIVEISAPGYMQRSKLIVHHP